MMAVRGISDGKFGIQAGIWRWAALGFFALAIAAGIFSATSPNQVGWLGIALLAAIGAVASILLFAVWPRDTIS